MLSPKLLFGLLFAVVVLVACQPSPTLPPANQAPSQVTIAPYTDEGEYVVFVVDSVTPLRSGERGPNSLVEFRLLVAATDNEGNLTGVAYCPGGEISARTVGDEIASPCRIKLAFSEADIADKLFIYFLGVDEDEISLITDIGIQIGSAVIAKGIVEALGVLAKGASLSSGPAFVLETAISIVGAEAADYFTENDVVGQHLISLSRTADWGVNQRVNFVTHDGGMRIGFHVDRAEVNQGDPLIVITDVPNLSTPTPPPPTSTPTLPSPPVYEQPIERLVLFDPNGRYSNTLRNGDTIDLGQIGTSLLDIRVEADSSASSILFLLDGTNLNLNGRNLENVPPFIVGGDVNGQPYGNWDWASLAGGTHTISVWACSRPGGEGDCAPPINVSFHVKW